MDPHLEASVLAREPLGLLSRSSAARAASTSGSVLLLYFPF